jgi:hypothetical protein
MTMTHGVVGQCLSEGETVTDISFPSGNNLHHSSKPSATSKRQNNVGIVAGA